MEKERLENREKRWKERENKPNKKGKGKNENEDKENNKMYLTWVHLENHQSIRINGHRSASRHIELPIQNKIKTEA